MRVDVCISIKGSHHRTTQENTVCLMTEAQTKVMFTQLTIHQEANTHRQAHNAQRQWEAMSGKRGGKTRPEPS